MIFDCGTVGTGEWEGSHAQTGSFPHRHLTALYKSSCSWWKWLYLREISKVDVETNNFKEKLPQPYGSLVFMDLEKCTTIACNFPSNIPEGAKKFYNNEFLVHGKLVIKDLLLFWGRPCLFFMTRLNLLIE